MSLESILTEYVVDCTTSDSKIGPLAIVARFRIAELRFLLRKKLRGLRLRGVFQRVFEFLDARPIIQESLKRHWLDSRCLLVDSERFRFELPCARPSPYYDGLPIRVGLHIDLSGTNRSRTQPLAALKTLQECLYKATKGRVISLISLDLSKINLHSMARARVVGLPKLLGKALKDGCIGSLVHLDLAQNWIGTTMKGHAHLLFIAEALAYNTCSLKHLNLSGNHLFHKPVDSELTVSW